jgi:hypothetical protein
MRVRAGLPVAGVIWALLSAAAAPAQTAPQNYAELRAAGSPAGLYRFLEYNHLVGGRLLVDVVYFGVPGQNEFYVGAGWPLAPLPAGQAATRTLSITPLIYAVAGKENGQRGVALGLFVAGGVGDWSVYGFGGYFEPVAGAVPRYVFLDSGDLSRRLGRWEVGGSAGLFYAAGQRTAVVGPVVVRTDRAGAWRVYVRGGDTLEFRLARTFSF